MNNKKSTIGDIINLSKEENKINTMLEIIKRRVDNNRGDDFLDLNLNNEFRIDDIITPELDNDVTEIAEDDITYISNLHSFNDLLSIQRNLCF